MDPNNVKLSVLQQIKPNMQALFSNFILDLLAIFIAIGWTAYVAALLPTIIVNHAIINAILSFGVSLLLNLLAILPIIIFIGYFSEDGKEHFDAFVVKRNTLLLEAKKKILDSVVDDHLLK